MTAAVANQIQTKPARISRRAAVLPPSRRPRGGDMSVLFELAEVLEARKRADPAHSYSARLLQGGPDLPLAKITEEAAEVVAAAQNDDRANLRHELADLWFHCLAVMARWEVPLSEVLDELAARRGRSGLAEFAARRRGGER